MDSYKKESKCKMAAAYLSILLLCITTSQLAAYPYPSHGYPNVPKDDSIPLRYRYKSFTKPRAYQAGTGKDSDRYQQYAVETKYYNVYNKQQLQAAETAQILDHIVEVNGLSKPTTAPPTTTDPNMQSCLRTAQNEGTALAMNQIPRLDIDTLNKLLNDEPDTIVMNAGANIIFQHQSCLTAFQYFFLEYYSTPPPSHIWVNLSPPLYCLEYIMQQYTNRNVHIHVGRVRQTNVTETESIFKCMAVMIRNGSQIAAWDWVTFQIGLDITDTCQKIIEDSIDAVRDKQDEFNEVAGYCGDVSQVQEDIIDRWCN